LRQSLKLLRFTQLYDNVNPFTEAVVGDWDLPDEVCAPGCKAAVCAVPPVFVLQPIRVLHGHTPLQPAVPNSEKPTTTKMVGRICQAVHPRTCCGGLVRHFRVWKFARRFMLSLTGTLACGEGGLCQACVTLPRRWPDLFCLRRSSSPPQVEWNILRPTPTPTITDLTAAPLTSPPRLMCRSIKSAGGSSSAVVSGCVAQGKFKLRVRQQAQA